MSDRNLFVISLSDRPTGIFRTSLGPVRIPTVPLEYVRERLDALIGENRVHQKELGTGDLLGYIQDSSGLIDLIDHALFLYVESSCTFKVFLEEYATMPEQCPVCDTELDDLDADEQLQHIIDCRREQTQTRVRAISATTSGALLSHNTLQ